ncbi:pyridoxamine 5'-phosphate oxidase family protein [Rhizobiaceae bacterium BDR2-2]|uniref:Pyridoxamine 5'-phosphate oxidase family protein n=1 Tax=Ectorhizobium quercum TaxID=2965071 RepID=A0AAE3N0R5_9HYPH|nr:pyridoxamine 5'-phosphate oxidase family protein [Ectorhizobium quercum]MCX8998021.1 pyridoxamine 5'-phosphate oxidase family protein [Ectorhizobium quercum]
MSDGSTTTAYPVTPRNRVRRLHERGRYDHEAVHAVLDAGMLCHVAYVIDGQPYCTPTIHWREGDRLYWHGSSASRMLRHEKAGAPVCVTVSHLDGLVLARSGFNHSANYRSAMCFGTAFIVDDPEEKARALAAVTDRFWPGRAATLRPVDPQEAKATTVIGMTIEDAAVKARAKGVGDDDTQDAAFPVWAGVIPVETVIGALRPSPVMPPAVPVPDSVRLYGEGRRLDEALVETQALYEKR